MENPYVHELRAELNLLLKKQAQFWNLEALGRQRIPNSSNTRSGKRSFTNYATNLPTPLPSSGLKVVAIVTTIRTLIPDLLSSTQHL